MVEHARDLLEILMMSLALGADAFSLAIGVGLQGIRRRRAVQLSASIGVFHLLLTLVGISAGMMMLGVLGQVAQWFGAFLLLGLGIHMAYSCLFRREEGQSIGSSMLAILLFSAGVSIDALSVGFSLGLRSTAYGIISAIIFGFAGAALCFIGLFVGKRANRMIGMYGELIGAFILMAFGVHFLVP